jgi:uncharacterized protein (DUF2126 family)
VEGKHTQAGYEDAMYYAWKERRLPVNVTVSDNKLDRKEDRLRLARVFEKRAEPRSWLRASSAQG